MGRTKRSAKLDTWNARKKLPLGKTNQDPIAPGQYLGFRRPATGAAGSWFARWRQDGKILQERLGTADDFQDANGVDVLSWDQAQEKAKAWFHNQRERAQCAAGGEPFQDGPLTVAQALQAYFEDGRRRGVKGLNRDEHRAALWITPELGALEVAKLTRRRIEAWLAQVAESPRRVRTGNTPAPDAPVPKPRNFRVPRAPKPQPIPPAPPATDDEKRARKDSANRTLTVLKAALNHALDRRLVTVSGEAWREVKPYRGTTKARVRFLTMEEQVRLVNVCPQDFRQLVQGALLTGGRYGELARAQVQDFDPTGGTLFLIGKGTGEGKPRRVVLTEEGQAFFQEITAGRPAGDLIFQRAALKRVKHLDRGQAWGHNEQGRYMAAACTAAELEPVTFHELRHSYASMLVNAGCPLAYVAAQLGHTDTRMVEKHYGHLAPNALAESVRALMPKLGLLEKAKVVPLKVAGKG
jgi:integrase